jgi:hypothetical protein
VILSWIASIGLVSYLSLTPQLEFPLDFRWSDKVYHLAAYAWLSSLPLVGFTGLKRALTGALCMIPLGIVLECGQAFVPGRFFSGRDMMANLFGSILGILFGFYLFKRKTWNHVAGKTSESN